ncbi:MAG: DNA repair protein RecO [Planctomycetaceae bacterium]
MARARRPKTPGATDALVARLHEFGESSAVAVLLTSDRGTVHALAKGAKRTRNSFLGPLDRGVLYRVRLGRRAGEGLCFLNASTAREPFPRLRGVPARFCAATLVLEVTADLMREEEPSPELFRLAAYTLKVLDRAPRERLPLAATLFLARAVELSGHAPQLGACVECGLPLGRAELPLLSAGRGGILHAACGQGEPGARSVSRDSLTLLALLRREPATRALQRQAAPATLRELRGVLLEWLERVLARRFHAATAMEEEFSLPVPSAG